MGPAGAAAIQEEVAKFIKAGGGEEDADVAALEAAIRRRLAGLGAGAGVQSWRIGAQRPPGGPQLDEWAKINALVACQAKTEGGCWPARTLFAEGGSASPGPLLLLTRNATGTLPHPLTRQCSLPSPIIFPFPECEKAEALMRSKAVTRELLAAQVAEREQRKKVGASICFDMAVFLLGGPCCGTRAMFLCTL